MTGSALLKSIGIQYAIRYVFGAGLGYLLTSEIANNLRPVSAELRRLSQTAAGLNGQVPLAQRIVISLAAGAFANMTDDYLESLWLRNMTIKPAWASQLGGLGNLALIVHNVHGFIGTIAYLEDTISEMAMAIYQLLPPVRKQQVNVALNVPGGVQSIRVELKPEQVVWKALFRTLEPEAKVRLIRVMLATCDQGGEEAVKNDFVSLVRHGLTKYGTVYINEAR